MSHHTNSQNTNSQTDTQASASAILNTLEGTVREQPLLTMGAVLGFGLLIGMAIAKQSRPPRRLQKLQNWAGTDYRSRDLERSIDRIENAINRTAPRAYEGFRDSVSQWPDMISSIATAWQNKAVSKLGDVKAAMPDVADIKSAAATAAQKWAK